MGDGTQGNINPLQIIIGLNDEEVKNEKFKKNNMLLFYVRKLYENFNITEDTNILNLKAHQFPIFQDLKELLLTELKNISLTEKERELLKTLLIIISRFVDNG